MNLKAHFRRFLEADPERLHFAAHSHHLWPDVTFTAQAQCWDDAARLADRKWDHVFGQIYPTAQERVARVLNLSDAGTLVFGPNTHGFVLRLLSCLPAGKTLDILTTDGEFHSFARQARRLEEEGLARVTRVPLEPFGDFPGRFAGAAARGGHDLVYVSQVFFDSGYAVPDIAALVAAVPDDETLVAVDGYHAFMALPTDLSAIEARAFYLAGGYKYAMAGEGAAFLHAPRTYAPRPRDTGWYAAFGALEAGESGRVGFTGDARRFLGATFDPVGIYRLSAVLDWLDGLNLSVAGIHARVLGLQRHFVEGLGALGLGALNPAQIMVPIEEDHRGHFLTFRTPEAGDIYRALLERNVITDHRGGRLRLGFGLYHDEEDVERLVRVLGEVLD